MVNYLLIQSRSGAESAAAWFSRSGFQCRRGERKIGDRGGATLSPHISVQAGGPQETIPIGGGDAEIESVSLPFHREGNIDAGLSESPDGTVETR